MANSPKPSSPKSPPPPPPKPGGIPTEPGAFPAQVGAGSPVASRMPTNKAVAATGGSAVGAAISTLLVYGIELNHALPDTVSGAITTLVTAAVTLAAAYFTPPGTNETIILTPEGPRSARR